jgi:hypothetical protein
MEDLPPPARASAVETVNATIAEPKRAAKTKALIFLMFLLLKFELPLK